MTPRTPVPLALAFALAAMLPVERALVTGSLADALAYAAGAEDEDAVATVRPPGGDQS